VTAAVTATGSPRGGPSMRTRRAAGASDRAYASSLTRRPAHSGCALPSRGAVRRLRWPHRVSSSVQETIDACVFRLLGILLVIGHVAAIQNSVTVSIGEAPGRTPATGLTTSRDAKVRKGFPGLRDDPKWLSALLAGYVVQRQTSGGRGRPPPVAALANTFSFRCL
jgi:hypothetical protein